jgi:hypothetical protein
MIEPPAMPILPPSSRTLFFSLPPEIRNILYGVLVLSDEDDDEDGATTILTNFAILEPNFRQMSWEE